MERREKIGILKTHQWFPVTALRTRPEIIQRIINLQLGPKYLHFKQMLKVMLMEIQVQEPLMQSSSCQLSQTMKDLHGGNDMN